MTVSTHKANVATESAATATITVIDGDLATTNQFTEGTHVVMRSHDGTTRVYVLCDASESGASAAGTVLTEGDDTGASTLSFEIAALGTCVAFNANLNTATQAAVLNALKAAVVHANGHNGKITAGDDLTAADGNQSIIFTQATKGEAGDTVIISNIDTALMTTTNFSGGHAEGDKKDKHTILNGGTTSGFNRKTNTKSIVDIVGGRKLHGAFLGTSTGTAYKVGLSKATSGVGTFAYNPSESIAKRGTNFAASTPDSGFLIRGGVVNKISGTSLNPIISGSDTTSRRAGNIHPKEKYYRKGSWSDTIFDIFNGTRSDVDGNAKTTISGYGSAVTLATDHAAHVGRGVAPRNGEIIILFDFTTFTNNYKDYSAITG